MRLMNELGSQIEVDWVSYGNSPATGATDRGLADITTDLPLTRKTYAVFITYSAEIDSIDCGLGKK
jgi:hypothetical protein